jgi:hypothetical protein
MIRVRFWSVLLDKEVVQTFNNYEEAWQFANKYNGILFI